MRILAIETSCDETAAAIVEDGKKILSNIVTSSSELHEKTGGIIPEIAAREQVKCIIPIINKALSYAKEVRSKKWEAGYRNEKLEKKSRFSPHYLSSHLALLTSNIDALAVTVGPGLNGSLLVGTEAAKTIAYVTNKPIIPVNHVIAHIYANFLSDKDTLGEVTQRGSPDGGGIRYPAIALIVSGGHTELFLMTSETKLKWLGGTRDDAAGEAFDKTARLLGLGFPGGPAISAAAEKFQISNFKFQINKLPRPMINEEILDFSFSGLKTAVMREVNKFKIMGQWDNGTMIQLAHEIQESITDVLVSKTLKAAIQFNAKSILLGGGVAANQRLKEKFKLEIGNWKLEIGLHIPPPNLCTDNAAYIASYAYFHNKPVPWQKIQSQPDLRVEV